MILIISDNFILFFVVFGCFVSLLGRVRVGTRTIPNSVCLIVFVIIIDCFFSLMFSLFLIVSDCFF